MTTSGSVDYSNTQSDLISAALRKCGQLSEGETASAQQIADASGDLNRMVKGWQAKGVKLWKSVELVLFLDTESQKYSLGPTGDFCCVKDDLITAELASDAALGAGTVTLDSATDIATTYIIGIVQDDDTIHWTTVNGAPAGAVVTLTAVTTAAATTGNAVYAFAAKAARPLRISHARRRDDAESEIPIDVNGEEDYYNLPNKSSEGPPLMVYYKPTLGNGTLHVWPVTDTVDVYLILVGFMPLEDLDDSGNTPDFPQECYQAIVWGLADEIKIEYGVDRETSDQIEKKAKYWLDMVTDFDVEEADIVITGDFS
ncbi:hypothetical protein KW797_03140 [Candidatus Parcubacteria bacterium]|nr:hypothetical protein [Candidatus Parcubacteria bacterium]